MMVKVVSAYTDRDLQSFLWPIYHAHPSFAQRVTARYIPTIAVKHQTADNASKLLVELTIKQHIVDVTLISKTSTH